MFILLLLKKCSPAQMFFSYRRGSKIPLKKKHMHTQIIQPHTTQEKLFFQFSSENFFAPENFEYRVGETEH